MGKNPALEEDLEAIYSACKELSGSIARVERIAHRVTDEGVYKRLKTLSMGMERERKSLAETAGIMEGIYRRGNQ